MKKIVITTTMAWLSITMAAQNKNTKKADKHYNRLEYVDAIDAYLKLTEKGKDDAYVHKQLAEAYKRTSNTVEAEKWYAKVVSSSNNSEDIFWYAQMLKANGKNNEFKRAMHQFADQNPQDTRAIAFKKDPDFLDKLLAVKPGFTAKNTMLSSEYSDFGAYPHNGKVYFASARNTARKTYGWNKQPTLDIYSANVDNGNFSDIQLLKGDVNTKYNEAGVAISPDGNRIYFTRTNYLEGKFKKDESGISNLKIYSAERNGDKWENIKELTINNNAYSTGHPAVSPDGKTLYFSSDRPGGYGSTDIYRAAIAEDGTLGTPENLGPAINTPADEQFPFIGKDNTLYFASNGHMGMGGLDVFYAKANGSGFEAVTNPGKPVNSSQDDFAFFVDESGNGYVSSNRAGGAGSDDIYSIEPIEPIEETPAEEITTQPEPVVEKVATPTVFEPVGFDFDSSAISEVNAAKLDELAQMMISQPNASLTVNAYTDNRGSDTYNLNLSQRRAKATVDYLTQKGVDPKRIKSEGFGVKNPKVDCGANCSEEQHALNRRSEFVITIK